MPRRTKYDILQEAIRRVKVEAQDKLSDCFSILSVIDGAYALDTIRYIRQLEDELTEDGF